MTQKICIECDICGLQQINDDERGVQRRSAYEKFVGPNHVNLNHNVEVERYEKTWDHLCPSCFGRLKLAIRNAAQPPPLEAKNE